MELMNNKIIYFEKRLEMNELKKIIKEYIKKIGKEKIAIIVSIITIVTVGFNLFIKRVVKDSMVFLSIILVIT